MIEGIKTRISFVTPAYELIGYLFEIDEVKKILPIKKNEWCKHLNNSSHEFSIIKLSSFFIVISVKS